MAVAGGTSMIIEEYPYNGREDRIRHYSDSSFIIRQNETGNEYGEAVDTYPCPYTYTETDIPIESDEVDPETALNELLEVIGSDS